MLVAMSKAKQRQRWQWRKLVWVLDDFMQMLFLNWETICCSKFNRVYIFPETSANASSSVKRLIWFSIQLTLIYFLGNLSKRKKEFVGRWGRCDDLCLWGDRKMRSRWLEAVLIGDVSDCVGLTVVANECERSRHWDAFVLWSQVIHDCCLFALLSVVLLETGEKGKCLESSENEERFDNLREFVSIDSDVVEFVSEDLNISWGGHGGDDHKGEDHEEFHFDWFRLFLKQTEERLNGASLRAIAFILRKN